MIITNEHGLPKAFVEMAKREYILAPNEYRVTSLLKGIREVMLIRRHHHEIKVDVADMVWLLFGTAVHGVLEHQKEGDNEIKEERLKIPVGDYILSGQFDLYNADSKKITDYKTASVWKIIFENYEDWKKQLLIYAYMLCECGFPVERGEVIAFLKDHSKRDAKTKSSYPKLPVRRVRFKFTDQDFENIKGWIYEKFKEIALVEQLPDDELPVCSPEERFNSGDKFAVMKKNRKRALRVLDSEDEAKEWMSKNEGDFIECRKGEDKKCIDYCFAKDFCSYYREKYGKEDE